MGFLFEPCSGETTAYEAACFILPFALITRAYLHIEEAHIVTASPCLTMLPELKLEREGSYRSDHWEVNKQVTEELGVISCHCMKNPSVKPSH
jgi:hypothetical protein